MAEQADALGLNPGAARRASSTLATVIFSGGSAVWKRAWMGSRRSQVRTLFSRLTELLQPNSGHVVELADTAGSNPAAARREGSTPSLAIEGPLTCCSAKRRRNDLAFVTENEIENERN